ncbi:MAG: 50S ribosomal protein L25 [Acidobacteriota bacterium]
MSNLVLEVEPRETTGKGSNRRLRAAGHVPAVVYGGDLDSTKIQVSRRAFEELVRGVADENPVFRLHLAGTDKKRHAMIREIQADPITGHLVHIDFIRISMDEEVELSVQLEIVGDAPGVKSDGGILDFVTREVEIACLPDKIPASIHVDISGLEIGDHVEAGALQLPDGVRLREDEGRVLVSIQAPRLAVEETDEDDEMAEPEVLTGAKDEE